MLGVIVFIIILIAILSSMSKNKRKANHRNQSRQPSFPPPQEVRQMAEREPAERKQQQKPTYKTERKEAVRTVRAAAESLDASDIRRDFEVMTQNHLWEAAGVEADDGAILASAKLNSYEVEKNNEADSRKDLLDPVYDLIAMGPDTSIPGRRDFEAEAEKLLQRLTL